MYGNVFSQMYKRSERFRLWHYLKRNTILLCVQMCVYLHYYTALVAVAIYMFQIQNTITK